MTSKERVHAALRRQPVDRVPVYMWFHPETRKRLSEILEIPERRVDEAMGNDIRQTWVNNNHAMEGIVHENDGDSHVDYWGIRWVKEGPFNQVADYPLAEATEEEVLKYELPFDHMENLLRQMDPVVENIGECFLGCDVSPCGFEMYWRLRGMENVLLDFAGEPDLAKTMVKRCADFAVALSEAACKRYPLDWLWAGDDVASQAGMIMSPASWRSIVRPDLQRVFDVARKANIWVAYHCCGSMRDIIGDLVEMGLNVLNPIQCNCPGMSPSELKSEFGKNLTFMGGVDTQGVLPNGSAVEVRRATRCLLDIMTCDGGGYILAASHTIPPETPDENIFAMYAEAGISREEIFDRAAAIRTVEKETSLSIP